MDVAIIEQLAPRYKGWLYLNPAESWKQMAYQALWTGLVNMKAKPERI